MPAIDVVVVGLGAMGSAAVYHLTRRNRRVIGIDRFRPPHEYGSSHGATRIIRLEEWLLREIKGLSLTQPRLKSVDVAYLFETVTQPL